MLRRLDRHQSNCKSIEAPMLDYGIDCLASEDTTSERAESAHGGSKYRRERDDRWKQKGSSDHMRFLTMEDVHLDMNSIFIS